MKLSQLGEFGLIKEIKRICDNGSKNVLLNIGDDAAAVKTGSGTTLISSDMLVEGVHFDLKFTSYYQLGHKVLAVNLSDIYAMDGEPKYFLLNIGIPNKCEINDIKDLYRGMRKLADMHGVAVIGGDTSSSEHGLVLSGTIIGEAKRVISRKGAKPGDSIYVAGTLGDSAIGLEILKQGKGKMVKGIDKEYLCKRHLMPEPRPLKKTKDITAMIDVSDGLLIDLSHICDESAVGAVIYEEKIPLSKELSAVSKKSGKDPLSYALKGGEDFVLLFSSSAKSRKDAVRIGEIINKGRYIIDSNGKKQAFRSEGYEHFKK
ncbi:MAG: thiamine-phosphate kinase [Thermodesulfovibrionia bacterium]|nr:thiamine-phosphate kinase [Thermodesulfovibrionia bacterium]